MKDRFKHYQIYDEEWFDSLPIEGVGRLKETLQKSSEISQKRVFSSPTPNGKFDRERTDLDSSFQKKEISRKFQVSTSYPCKVTGDQVSPPRGPQNRLVFDLLDSPLSNFLP